MRVAGPTVTLAGWVGILCASVAVAQNPVNNANWPTERPPRPLAARQINFPPFEVRTLDNGLRVLTILQHEQPAITVRLIVGVGAAQDPQGKAGLASLVGQLLDQGTTTRSAEQIADSIDTIGGALGTGAGADLSFANVVVL